MTEGACDVGFTNNTVFINYTAGGSQAQPWSTRPASDFRILCRSGGCTEITDYQTCSNARVCAPSQPTKPPPPPPPPAPLHPAPFHCPFHSHCALLGVPLLLMCIIDPALQKNDVCRFVHTSCLLFTCYRSHMYADILSSHTAVYPWQRHACITALLPAWHAA